MFRAGRRQNDFERAFIRPPSRLVMTISFSAIVFHTPIFADTKKIYFLPSCRWNHVSRESGHGNVDVTSEI